ncbi:MAG: hypothetical protein SNF69_00480 [Rikenellaceae bacterium]
MYANEDAEAIVQRVLAAMEDCNPYKVEIEVNYAGSSIAGYYEVDNLNYYISIDHQELYGDPTVKYEVFNSRREVIIDSVSPTFDGNLLNNPATAFASIKNHYSASLISNVNGFTTLELRPHSTDDNSMETIILTVLNSTMLPNSITYQFGADEVVIKVLDISRLASGITLYDSSKYTDYEIIDFR